MGGARTFLSHGGRQIHAAVHGLTWSGQNSQLLRRRYERGFAHNCYLPSPSSKMGERKEFQKMAPAMQHDKNSWNARVQKSEAVFHMSQGDAEDGHAHRCKLAMVNRLGLNRDVGILKPCNVNCHSLIVKATHVGEHLITRGSSALLHVLASLMAEGSKEESRPLSACFIDCVFAFAVHMWNKSNSSQSGSWPPIKWEWPLWQMLGL